MRTLCLLLPSPSPPLFWMAELTTRTLLRPFRAADDVKLTPDPVIRGANLTIEKFAHVSSAARSFRCREL